MTSGIVSEGQPYLSRNLVWARTHAHLGLFHGPGANTCCPFLGLGEQAAAQSSQETKIGSLSSAIPVSSFYAQKVKGVRSPCLGPISAMVWKGVFSYPPLLLDSAFSFPSLAARGP